MECFSVDESGYTGFDLLNPEQRFQGASALAIAPPDAARLIREHFPKLQAPELKYSQLARRANNRGRLLALQRDVLAQHACVTYVCDKRYLLILMFLDYAVEPAYYALGMDFYRDGQNYSLASLLYYTGPSLLGRAEFDTLMSAFQRAMHEKTAAALQALVLAARRTNWQTLPEALGPLAQGSPHCLSAIAQPEVTTDAAFVVLQALISRTEMMAGGPYRIEHDRSKNLTKYNAILRRFVGHDQAVAFRQTEITSLAFPLKLTMVSQVESKTSPAVQLADLLIGAAIEAAHRLGTPEGNAAAGEVLGQYTHEQFIHLLPDLDFAEQKRFRQGSQASEFIDYFAQHFARG